MAHRNSLDGLLGEIEAETDRAIEARNSGWVKRSLWTLRTDARILWERLLDVDVAARVLICCNGIAAGLILIAAIAILVVEDGMAQGVRVHPVVPVDIGALARVSLILATIAVGVSIAPVVVIIPPFFRRLWNYVTRTLNLD